MRIGHAMVSRWLRAPSWRSLVLTVLFAAPAAPAHANSLTLAWDPSTSSNVAGYTIAYGTQSGYYTKWVDVGNATMYTLTGLNDGIYYLAVRAYTTQRVTSSYSNEVIAAVGSLGTCTTPDPFIGMGGGVCYNGGWLPPGMIPTAPAPAPAPAPTVTVQGCSTPDPFAAMGGGTCYNGGWLPPGVTPPGGTTQSAPAPTPPPPPPPTSTQGCTSPDPFATMGGGTCYNGGWLPPGMAIPGGSSSPAPSPAPAPAPPPPAPAPSTQGCTSPDPFAGMGGGTCYNGGWLPPGMAVPGGTASTPTTPSEAGAAAPACVTSDPFTVLGGGVCYNGGWLPPGSQITITGVMHVTNPEKPQWAIEMQDGTVVTSPTRLQSGQLVNGATVIVDVITLPSPWSAFGVIVVEIVRFQIKG